MSVASKNLFALLGNDEEDDQPTGPVKTVDKTVPRTTKRNVEPQAPVKPASASNTSRRGPGGNEGAFRDRNAGSSANQRKPTEEIPRGAPRGGRGARERGGRGGRFPRERDDRHPRNLASGSEKQAAQSWGATEGDAEAKDEQAGEEIAQTELKEAVAEDAAPVEPEEPEDKSVSYTEYLAQLAEKKLALADKLEIRKPNEGTKVDKKWASAKPIAKEEGEDFIPATGGKAKRERERKAKQVVEIDQRYVEPDRPRGGRGGARGGASRGGPRGERPEGAGRGARGEGAGRGRGEGRGRGRGEGRGDFRGGRPAAAAAAAQTASINTSDENAFPSLGA